MLLADAHLELLTLSPWWIAVAAVAGAALLACAWIWRRPASGATPGESPARTSASPARLALGAGVAILVLTALLAWINLPLALPAFLLAALAAATVLLYRGVHAALSPWRRRTLVGLRLAGLAALVALLFRPVLAIVQGPAAAKPLVRVVIDASASMGYNDAPNQPNRFRQSALAVEGTLLPRLGQTYRVETFVYDQAGVHRVDAGALDGIVPDGQVTDLGAALAAGSGNAQAAHTVLFSDGIHNGPVAVDAELAQGAAGDAGVVDTVRVGTSDLEPSTVPDIAVVSVDGPQTAIVNNQVTLTATIKSTAMSDRTVRVQLMERDGAAAKQVEEQRLVLRSGGAGQVVQLHFTPEKVGRATVRVQVPVDPGERSDANNQQEFALLVTDPKLTVLYVEGRVRPEVGPLRRVMAQDPNLALVSMVQTTAGRFEMTGLKPGDDLKGLPVSAAQWKRFKVVVLGDLDASFLNSQQQKDLEQLVRDGAGLLMIGGQNSFGPGGWDKTTLAAMMPVSLERQNPAQINTPFVPELTALGAGHPIFRGIGGYFLSADGKKGSETVPELSGCVALGAPKAGATVLAVHPSEKGPGGAPATVLAVEAYGKGRTAAFAADTTYRWNLLMRAQGKESAYNRFWGQMIRWLASQENLEKKTGASVTAMLAKERFEAGGAGVPLRAAVTDKDGQATSYAQVWADITGPDGKTARVALAARGSEAGEVGMYESPAAACKPTMAGTYKVVFGASKDNAALGQDETSFTVLPTAGERDVLAAQPRTLQEIAQRTGGTAVEIGGVEALAEHLLAAAPPMPAASLRTIPLSRPRGFFLVFVGCLGVEWLLRRRWQLQ